MNLSHAVWAGWEEVFPSYPAYRALLLAIGALGFSLVEWLTRRALPVR